MPYVRDVFFTKVAPFADIVELDSDSFQELEQDFATKYNGVKAIYRCRAPGTVWGSLGEEFFKRVPESCKTLSHRKPSCALTRLVLTDD
jgi:glyoxylate reductase